MSSYFVNCTFCGSTNRVPAEKEGKSGHCGVCHNVLPSLYYHPLQLTEQTFDDFIRSFNSLVLAEFWAPWCPHCRAFEPAVRETAEILAGTAAIIQVNTQENPGLASRFGVKDIPVLFMLRQGKVIGQLPGRHSSDAIISWFRQKQ